MDSKEPSFTREDVVELVDELLHMFFVVLERERLYSVPEWAERAGYDYNVIARTKRKLIDFRKGKGDLPAKPTIMALALASLRDDPDYYETNMQWMVDLRKRYDNALRLYPRTITAKREAAGKQQDDDQGPNTDEMQRISPKAQFTGYRPYEGIYS
jgi:hypothetical protein